MEKVAFRVLCFLGLTASPLNSLSSYSTFRFLNSFSFFSFSSSSNWCVTTEGTLSQARTPDPIHPRRCARILVVMAVKKSSQYLHLTLVLSPGVLGSSYWTTWACSGPFSLTMVAIRFLILILRSSTMLLHRDIWNLEAGNFKLDQTRTKHWHARR